MSVFCEERRSDEKKGGLAAQAVPRKKIGRLPFPSGPGALTLLTVPPSLCGIHPRLSLAAAAAEHRKKEAEAKKLAILETKKAALPTKCASGCGLLSRGHLPMAPAA